MTATTAQLRTAAVAAFAHALVAAVLNRQLHAPDHRYVAMALQELVEALDHAAAVGVEMPLQLQTTDDRLLYDGQPLAGPSLQAASLLRRCRERQIAVLGFQPGLDADEANRFFDLLLLAHNRGALDRGTRDQALQALGVRHVRVTLRTPGDPGDRRRDCDAEAAALHRYQDLADCLQQNHARAQRDQELAVDAAATVVEQTLAQFEEPSTLLALATQDDVDRFTVGHSVRVALLALQVARQLGADRDQLVQVGTAALLHDIGKSKVPQEILWKRGRLSPEEWHWMAQHPRLGAQILLEQHEHVDPATVGAAFCHHMAPHGRGYPQPALPIAPSGTSRLVRVCDVFEALTSVRPYKRALLPVEAYAVMCRNAAEFDPGWLRALVRTLGVFPSGTRVRLDDGAEAIVTAQGPSPTAPLVRLLTGPGGADLPAGAPDVVRIGVAAPGQAGRGLRIAEVCSHDRCVAVPDWDAAELAPAAAHACLPDQPCAGPPPHG